MLEVRDLHVHYGAVHALQGVTLEVRQGEIVTLIGSNGAGKSTTLRAISGMVPPSRGEIRFEGRTLAARAAGPAGAPAEGAPFSNVGQEDLLEEALKRRERLSTGRLLQSLYRRVFPERHGLAPHVIVGMGIAHAPEGRGIFANLTVEENLRVGAFVRTDKDGIQADTDKVFGLFPRLLERRKQLAGTLSGGEQQMLAIGRALLARPRLLLLDEPSLGLAPQIVKTIFRIVRDINAGGTTILLVEQNAAMALDVAHRGYVLEVGRIVLADDAKALAASDEVRKAYLGVG